MDDEHTQSQPVEPTTPVEPEYVKAYTSGLLLPQDVPTTPGPYYGADFIGIPPPPPQRRRGSLGLFVMCLVIAILLFLSAGLFYLARSFAVSQEKPTPIVRFVPVTPTQNATATQASLVVTAGAATATQASAYATATQASAYATVDAGNGPTTSPIYTAQDVYTQFTTAGIAMANEGTVPASWWHQCCSWDPANGAQSFTDVSSGGNMVIALFGHATAAQEDVAQMDANSTHPGDYLVGTCLLLYWSASTNLTPYEQVMNQYCA